MGTICLTLRIAKLLLGLPSLAAFKIFLICAMPYCGYSAVLFHLLILPPLGITTF